MKCLVIFGSENSHPLAWMLNRKHRHVWCALQDLERGVWVSYNWHRGLPIIQAEAAADYDLAAHYRDQGYSVVEIERGIEPRLFPFVMNNCVGHVKVICALRTFTVTPHWLYRSMTKGKRPMKFKQLFTVPGFGGSPAPAPPPPPPPPPVKSAAEVRAAEQDARRRAAGAMGRQSTILTSATATDGSGVVDTGGKKTLLGE
jgi:hypothetical protein